MTAPLEFEEPEPIPMSGLVRVRCASCGTPGVACAPDQARVALCGGCRASVASGATTILRLPVVPPPLVGQDTPNALRATEAVSAQAVQDPEMVCDPLYCGHAIPAPVIDLKRLAIEHYWATSVRHSRGGVMGGAGKQLAVAELWSVRFRRGEWQGYAVRRGASWESVCVTGAALPPFLALGVTELRQWLADPERPASWYAEIVQRVQDQARAAKIVKCPGPGECVLHLVALAFVPLGVEVVNADHTHRADGAIKIKNSRREPESAL